MIGRMFLLHLLVFSASPAAAQLLEYEVTFDAMWSADSHPTDYPSSAHFSGLIGGTHNDQITFWEMGQLASPGIKQMAETGSKSNLSSEVEAAIAAGQAGEVISGGGIGSGTGNVSESFSVGPDHSLVTITSMIAPSPDWFVGVGGLDLRQNGFWLEELEVDLFPYDAGTDSGETYRSPNAATRPPMPIHAIESQPVGNGTPLGTLTFRLKTLLGDADLDGDVDSADRTILSTNFTGAWLPGEGNLTFSQGDFDGDGDSDTFDQNIQIQHWTGARMAHGLSGLGAVPEPSGPWPLVFGSLFAARFMRRTLRHTIQHS